MQNFLSSFFLSILAVFASSCSGEIKKDIFSRKCWHSSEKDSLFTAYFAIFNLGDGHSKIQVFSKFCRIDPERDNPVTMMNLVRVNEFKPNSDHIKYFGDLVVSSNGIHNLYAPIRIVEIHGVVKFDRNEVGGINLSIDHLEFVKELPGESENLYRDLLLGREMRGGTQP